ncbi:MAG TPA: 2,3-bisphosphoglycerate-independent phosphoglycerate mutase [Gammaproteobacteria bacterium]|jgi:2,3-bisphosphoglycerate-independent phosphoglycerate mutase|nr:2,3-bisphosphoglycerate-independent phosphoglycerate mutase [Gammaproteobacteria bacterium]
MSTQIDNVPRRPTVLIIMDGLGHNPSRKHNAVALAKTPNLDELYAKFPLTVVEASGLPVGLPDGQMGNSEVGHLTLGCGQVLRQDLVKINDAIDDGSFYTNPALSDILDDCAANKRPLHLLGLVSDGGIHSHLRHLLALIEAAGQRGVKPLLHMITDGRDTVPRCATRFLESVEAALERAGGAIATVVGRYYALDRDNRWERVELAWQAIVNGEGRAAESAHIAIESAWAAGEADEFIKPVVLPGYEAPQAGDQFLFFNFRKDRPRELTSALALSAFDPFARGDAFEPFRMATMTMYDSEYDLPVLFEKEVPKVTLGEVIANAGVKQFHSAETEKYPHVTFFFNGGREAPYPGEDRKLIPSPKVATYDEQPEMSAYGIAEAVVEAIEREEYGFVICNFANGDMVGHTGVREAVIKSVSVVDEVVGQVIDAARQHGYSVVLTADHGNADLMVDPVTGGPHTQHTVYPVPCTVVDESHWRLSIGAGLSSIAPTVLELMGLEVPPEMTGHSLLLENLGPV